jgi:hypothetical protein
MAGKGSKPRPVNPRTYAANYAAIRWSDPPTVVPAVSTPVGTAGPAVRIEPLTDEEFQCALAEDPSSVLSVITLPTPNCQLPTPS